MFCPRCAQQNADDAKFCRACSENLRVIAQAMTQHLPVVLMSKLDEYLGRRNERLRRDGVIYFLAGLVPLFIDFGDPFLLFTALWMFGLGVWYMLAYKRSVALESSSGKPTAAPALKTMYCPRCGESNGVDTKFCRKCSENLHAVAQAMRQRLPVFITRKLDKHIERQNHDIHSSSKRSALFGICVLALALVWLVAGGSGIAVAVLIFLACLYFGLSAWDMLVHKRHSSSVAAPANLPPATIPPATIPRQPLSPGPSQTAPQSVTEATTRRLDQTNERLKASNGK